MKTYNSEKKPIMCWCENPEDGAIEQAKNLANLPFTFKHVALMPDTHQGYGMPIGGVLATEGVVIPNAVGVDIGCGICAVKTSLTGIDTETLKKILGEIRKTIPVGFNKHKEAQDFTLMPLVSGNMPIVKMEYDNALKSLGTLGGGNHFIEIQRGDDGHLWVMIHSGSRNLGKQVADHYNKVAKEINKKYHSSVPLEWDLAFLPADSEEGKSYLSEMDYCVEFALANRKLMIERVMEIIEYSVWNSYPNSKEFTEGEEGIVTFDPIINIAHNYVNLENRFGKDVWVHRKGATLAATHTTGIIPGSQGTSSFIVRGKGNIMSFSSCSHGAGRKMGRKDAQRRLDLATEQRKLDRQGILHAIRGKNDLDEASGAYKDIETVMLEQSDLVEIRTRLTPLAVVKG